MFYRSLLFFHFFIILLVQSCNSDTERSTKPSTTKSSFESNQTMASFLADIAQKTDPNLNYSLNSKMAAQLKEAFFKEQSPQKKFAIKIDYAKQLLFAGQTQQAIAEFEEISKLLGGVDQLLSKERKSLLDFLAVAYLRLGEQQNCIEQHTAASCIVPLQTDGFHKIETGSRKAIELYTLILNTFPEDYQSKWLLNIAHMTLGEYPDKVPAKYRIAPEVFQSENKTLPHFQEVATGSGLDISGLSGGCNVDDFNNDGYLDVFATSYGLTDQAKLFVNNGDGTFKPSTLSSKLMGIVGGLNTIHADYNNDGFNDIFILRGAWMGKGGEHPNSLLHNNGDGTFTDVTKEAGLFSLHPTQTAAWADFNLDGYLDLFIGNESVTIAQKERLEHPCELYLNKGDGTFENVAGPLGLDIMGMIKGVTWGDINNDKLPDLYISDMVGKNYLFVNRGGTSMSDWKFEDIASTAGVQQPQYSFPCWFWDLDNDGFEDLFVSGYDLTRLKQAGADAGIEYSNQKRQAESPRIYKNNGDETFTDVTINMGLDKAMYTMGSNFGDLDNDGYLDFYAGTGAPNFWSIIPNRMFRNVGGQKFEEVTMGGFGHIQKGHGTAFSDIDNDGDQDIYTVMGGAYEGDIAQNILFENPGGANKWITLLLEGRKSNRSALHARIKVTIETAEGSIKTIHRVVSTGGTFGASSLQQEIGLGKAKRLVSIEVIWPNQEETVQKFENIKLNSRAKLIEGKQEVEYLKNKAITLKRHDSSASHIHH